MDVIDAMDSVKTLRSTIHDFNQDYLDMAKGFNLLGAAIAAFNFTDMGTDITKIANAYGDSWTAITMMFGATFQFLLDLPAAIVHMITKAISG